MSRPELRAGFHHVGDDLVYYEVAGSGPAVFLCHGTAGNHASWFQQVPVLASRFQVVNWDQRGFGRSVALLDDVDASETVDELIALMDYLGIERAHIVGQSSSGWAALECAIRHPVRVRSLVLANTVAGILSSEIEARLDECIRAADALGRSVPQVGVHRALGPSFVEREPERALLYQQIASLNQVSSGGLGNHLRHTSYSLDDVAELRVPVLFIAGEEDVHFPPDLVRMAAGYLTNAEVEEISGAGHSPYFESPDLWNRIVIGFFEAVDRGDSGLP